MNLLVRCLYCGRAAQEEKQRKKRKHLPARCDTRSNVGLTCTICKRFGCNVCLNGMILKLEDKVNKSNETEILNNDDWYKTVKSYLDTEQEFRTPDNFIGSCCEFAEAKKLLKNESNNQNLFTNLDNSVDDLDGALYLHEFGLLVNSPIGCVDIHGLGPQQQNPESTGTTHCVIPPAHASYLKSQKN